MKQSQSIEPAEIGALGRTCAKRLRQLRRERGMTLHECERLSNGAIKAVVLGSYERGTRAISLARLEELARLYEVPLQYFFGDISQQGAAKENRFIFDLRMIRNAQYMPDKLQPIKRFLTSIARKRSDWNGEVISLRGSDSNILELICDLDILELEQELQTSGFLFAGGANGQRSL